MDDLLGRILSFAAAHTAVRAVVPTGSRARDVAPADALSDLDLYYADALLFAGLDRWLANQSDVWVDLDPDRDSAALARGNAPRVGDGPEGARLVIFPGGRKVDFRLVPVAALEDRVRAGTTDQASGRGFRVLFDRDYLAARLAPTSGRPPPRDPPTAEQVRVLVEEYWFETYHVAKLPREYPPWSTMHDWFGRWRLDRTWEGWNRSHTVS